MIRKPALLILSIFAMAGIYDLMWAARPDYFRVQTGVNFLPLDLVQIAREYSAYSDKKPLPQFRSQQREETAIKRIEDVYQRFQQASVSLANKKSEYAKRAQEDTGESKSFQTSQSSQLDFFVAQKTAPFTIQIKGIRDHMQAILAASGVKSAENLPPGPSATDYANLNVQRARLEVQKAKAQLEAWEYGIRHLDDFQQESSQKEYLARYKQLEDLRKSIFAEQASTDKLRGDLYDAFVEYRTAAEAHLGYWDFLYFSVGAATTATFGDISPNSTSVRTLVCLQVLSSIVFVGLMVNELASRLVSAHHPTREG